MKKTTWIGLATILSTLSFAAYASTNSHSHIALQEQTITSSPLKGTDWIRQCIGQYPEVLWLADDNVRKTEEGEASLQGSYSKQLFGKKFIEFDRTMMTLHCLRLILNGSDEAYQEFTKAQPENTRLSRGNFQIMHEQGQALLNSQYLNMSTLEITQAMEASLVLGDIGKSDTARELFKPYGAKAPDHDDFHEEMIQILQTHPELCPTFNRLPPKAKRLIIETANLAHYGHITHLEGGPGMFSILRQRLVAASPMALSFDFFVHSCDVMGALGHVNNVSSLVYIEPTHCAMQGVLDSCKLLESPSKTELDAYNHYLAIRARWLGLNSDDRTERALTRMGAMLRLFTTEDGLILKKAIAKLSPEIRSQIIEQLDIREGEELDRTPTYMPAVLVNLANNSILGATKEERLSQAVILGLPFLARVLATHKQRLLSNEVDTTVPLNFNQAAGVAKKAPHTLTGKHSIDSEGNVSVS
ncbi:hypothetical protein COB21_01280 [Candidatus Aerophobetes bacterium]|uniref:Uncharacterized protein n=1 Tax=Aerophobetes bacterium TaxID=2030807 RepID=A0A2A4X6Z9_UNCAE|nr:MAG: hypothetical protein COB21_01280 [Candidatus Aerophobetes bacterium]